MTEQPRNCGACGAPPLPGRYYPDGQHWRWIHLPYCPRRRLDRFGLVPADEVDYLDHGGPVPYEPGDYVDDSSSARAR